MSQNKTKKRKLTKAERRRIKQRERRMKICLTTLGIACVGAIALLPLMNTAQIGRQYAYTNAEDIWYVDNGEMEIAAVSREEAANLTDMNQQLGTPTEENESDYTSGDYLSSTPTPTPEPSATPIPTLSATLSPQDALVDATATPKPAGTITVTAVGDCTLGGNTNSGGDGEARFAKCVAEKGYNYFFENVRTLFENDDLTIVNLEGPLTTSKDKRSGRTFNFRGDPSYVNILSGSSVEICNVANNHAFDFGKKGFTQTQKTLEQAGIGASGFGLEYYTEVNGYTVGSLGFTEWDYKTEDILNAVSQARQKCDLLLVSMHWGEERSYTPKANIQKLGRQIIDAGADLLIGTHTHVYGSIEQYKGKYILYSLGNFCFGGNKNPSVKQCAIFQQSFTISPDGKVEDGGINIIPASISSHEGYNDFQPTVLDGGSGTKLLGKIAKISNLTTENTLWMQQSYVIQNQLIQMDAATDESENQPKDSNIAI